MRIFRKVVGFSALALYVLVVLLLTAITWGEYADGTRSLPHAISLTVILLGLPAIIVIAAFMPELVFHSLALLFRKLFGKSKGAAT